MGMPIFTRAVASALPADIYVRCKPCVQPHWFQNLKLNNLLNFIIFTKCPDPIESCSDRLHISKLDQTQKLLIVDP